MNVRPASHQAAVVLVALTGVAALLFAAMLFAVAAGAVAFLGGGLTPFAWMVAVASLLFGVAGLAGAIGLWRGAAWAWPVAAAVQFLGTLGALVAVSSGGLQVPTLVGSALVMAGLLAVVAPDTRPTLVQ